MTAQLLATIDALSRANRGRRDPALERRILRLRHRAGVRLAGESAALPGDAPPADEPLPATSSPPEVTPDRLSPEVLRAAILGHGSLLVRGLVDSDESAHLAGEIERASEAREALAFGRPTSAGYFEEFEPEPPFEFGNRWWIGSGGSIVGADSPRLMFDLIETFEGAGLRPLVTGYLDARPLISVDKCTLRRVQPGPTAWPVWHQDGAFLGHVRALNVWLSLSRCGDIAPGLDIVPCRVDSIVPTGTEGALFDWSVSRAVVERAAGVVATERPIFEPGDALLFDELLLHATANAVEMTETRYAVETWFFAPSRFPSDYVPLSF